MNLGRWQDYRLMAALRERLDQQSLFDPQSIGEEGDSCHACLLSPVFFFVRSKT